MLPLDRLVHGPGLEIVARDAVEQRRGEVGRLDDQRLLVGEPQPHQPLEWGRPLNRERVLYLPRGAHRAQREDVRAMDEALGADVPGEGVEPIQAAIQERALGSDQDPGPRPRSRAARPRSTSAPSACRTVCRLSRSAAASSSSPGSVAPVELTTVDQFSEPVRELAVPRASPTSSTSRASWTAARSLVDSAPIVRPVQGPPRPARDRHGDRGRRGNAPAALGGRAPGCRFHRSTRPG